MSDAVPALPLPPRRSGRARGWVEGGVVAVVGAATSLLVVELGMLAHDVALPVAWQIAAPLAVGNIVLAAWSLRAVRQRRCEPERRLFLSPAIGFCSVLAAAVVFAMLTASWVAGVALVLWVSVITGDLVWAILYAALVLWVLCRRAGHPRGHVRARLGTEGRGATA